MYERLWFRNIIKFAYKNKTQPILLDFELAITNIYLNQYEFFNIIVTNQMSFNFNTP